MIRPTARDAFCSIFFVKMIAERLNYNNYPKYNLDRLSTIDFFVKRRVHFEIYVFFGL